MLEAADGNRFAAFAAGPETPASTGIVILPDVRGLYRFYEELALRFAERGLAAVAIDYFGRSAGVSKRDDEFPYMEHVALDDPGGDPGRRRAPPSSGLRGGGRRPGLQRSASASAGATPGSRPRAATGSRARSASTGARRAERPAGADPAGRRVRRADPRAPGGRRRQHHRRATTPPSSARSPRPGSSTSSSSTPGAPHSFFDRKQEEFAEASADAWERVLAFIERYAG